MRTAPLLSSRSPLVLLACVLIAGCEFGPRSVIAPTDATLRVSAAASFVPVSQSTTITVTLTKLGGEPVADGTEVVLRASLGELAQQKVRVRGGTATVPASSCSSPSSTRW